MNYRITQPMNHLHESGMISLLRFYKAAQQGRYLEIVQTHERTHTRSDGQRSRPQLLENLPRNLSENLEVDL